MHLDLVELLYLYIQVKCKSYDAKLLRQGIVRKKNMVKAPKQKHRRRQFSMKMTSAHCKDNDEKYADLKQTKTLNL